MTIKQGFSTVLERLLARLGGAHPSNEAPVANLHGSHPPEQVSTVDAPRRATECSLQIAVSCVGHGHVYCANPTWRHQVGIWSHHKCTQSCHGVPLGTALDLPTQSRSSDRPRSQAECPDQKKPAGKPQGSKRASLRIDIKAWLAFILYGQKPSRSKPSGKK